jgi:Fe-Mn family superoxide dismutase
VTITPNQDNPLMGSLPGAYPVKYAGCTPILGLDVWEHAYYLKHGPKRAEYIKEFFTAVDWAQVSKNYDHAKAGKAEEMVKAQ